MGQGTSRAVSVSLGWILLSLLGAGVTLSKPMDDLTYKKGQEIMLKVNSLTSTQTQVPLDYYHLPVCLEASGPRMRQQTLGEFLAGTKLQSSPYKISGMVDTTCEKLCQIQLNKGQASNLQRRIHQGYRNNWELGDMPSAVIMSDGEGSPRRFGGGFPIGFVDPLDEETAYVFNHVNMEVLYEDLGNNYYRIVQFAVEPLSVKHSYTDPGYEWNDGSTEGLRKPLATCFRSQPLRPSSILQHQVVKPNEAILYTYSVEWETAHDGTHWSNRWETYLTENHTFRYKALWQSIAKSLVGLLSLSVVVLRILMTNLRRKKEEDKPWKLLHGDVFRLPVQNSTLLCVFLGSGVQLAVSLFLLLVLAIFKVASQAKTGSIIEGGLVMYSIASVLAGYVSARMHKTLFKPATASRRNQCTRLAAILVPVVVFGAFMFLQAWLCSSRSTACVPPLEVLILVGIWSCVQVPLVYLGAYMGFRKNCGKFPTRTLTTPRVIPQSNFSPQLMAGAAGLAPFAALYLQVHFLMPSLWLYQYYTAFGVALITMSIALGTSALVAIALVYRQLNAENYQWWWFSFMVGGSCGVWMFLVAILWFPRLEAQMALTFALYFGYMVLISFGVFLVFGSLSFLASLWFVMKLYSTIEDDTSDSTSAFDSGSYDTQMLNGIVEKVNFKTAVV
eukprot:CAMPEP_0168730774 /NCGR_PEP_ID=MMETSP0724-20121128/6905_1 /TAXON_ID=265536 /ORGANISM="Amphiprora sp., Strain CCMP467" /LENGTH=671 /DNA_ID=CAMNT_0008777725 /DNA_START=26 /DNA_END=2042 /DNA_ORIENTATION=+